MNLHPLNKVVTDFFTLQSTEVPLDRVTGFGKFTAILVRAAAQKICVPAVTVAAVSYVSDEASLQTRKKLGKPNAHIALEQLGSSNSRESIENAIKEYPSVIGKRIMVVDQNGRTYKKTLAYLEPILEDLKADHLSEPYHILAFLYKLALASELEAEIDAGDIMGGLHIGYDLLKARRRLKNEEAKARLDALQGIWSVYSSPKKIDAFTLVPKVVVPSVQKRVSDLLDDAEFVKLSSSRHLLGVPGKAKAALLRTKRYVTEVLENRRYLGYIKAATDLVRVASGSLGLPVTLPDPAVLKGIVATGYNPPIIDLSSLKYQIAWQD